MPKLGDGTGLDGSLMEGEEGLSHYGGDDTNKLSGVIAGGQMGAHGDQDGHGGSRNTPIGPQPAEKMGLRSTSRGQKGSSE